ncbi:MAG: cyclic nucleotide-binding domain-containing protein [SAR324 cluster bacterium]|nr:cyclic nucleotide-binding domain-containing protein [SAR324 cluster bacterium]
MSHIKKVSVTSGVFWVGIQEADVYILCGCPADVVKHLRKMGLIRSVEVNNVTCEIGPNAILLSDVAVQNGRFANLAEFPVLQMLYRQGTIIPGHPNNTGIKPIIMGNRPQVEAQLKYIYRGNYGLISEEELMAAGMTGEQAHEMMQMKLKFSFGKIRQTEELINTCIVDDQPVEIRNEVFIRKTGFNKYEISYKNETMPVDMNLKPNQVYESPFSLGFHQLRPEFFAIVHSGEGDGWDINRPCMASVIMFQGKIYLLDAGPNIDYSLRALGIDISEVEGIFHTHAHDDHFAGLPTLMRSDHRLKYYATSLVRHSVSKKLAALMNMEESRFDDYFDVHDLDFNQWNDINGLDVMPIFSPHPVETNIFIFRAFWEDGYKTYAHFADIASMKVLREMISVDGKQPGISKEMYERVKADYMTPVHLKKIDIGGALIHGDAEDFKDDTTEKIILSHTSMMLTQRQKEIGSEAPFGMIDIMIPAHQDYLRQYAMNYLRTYFPNVNKSELHILTNCVVVSFNAGSILLKKDKTTDHVYLVLTGSVEFIDGSFEIQHSLSTGSMIGELSALKKIPVTETYRATSYIHVLQIPASLYAMFVQRNALSDSIEYMSRSRSFLQKTWLFGTNVSHPVQNRIIRGMEPFTYHEGSPIPVSDSFGLFLVEEGSLQVYSENHVIEMLGPGDFCGEDTVILQIPSCFQAKATRTSKIFFIPENVLYQIPIIHWKLLETFEKRMGILVDHLLDKDYSLTTF